MAINSSPPFKLVLDKFKIPYTEYNGNLDKDLPKILNELSKNGTTEYNLELAIYGEVRTKQNRIDFELFRMETLGWIDRKGSGTVGDAMICNLTDEGKRQLDFYNQYGMFDSSKVA